MNYFSRRFFVILANIVVLIGMVYMIAGWLHIPLGHFPGDVVFILRGRSFVVFYFPFVTAIVVSLIVSVIMFIGWRRTP
jgi:hypothetical protein